MAGEIKEAGNRWNLLHFAIFIIIVVFILSIALWIVFNSGSKDAILGGSSDRPLAGANDSALEEELSTISPNTPDGAREGQGPEGQGSGSVSGGGSGGGGGGSSGGGSISTSGSEAFSQGKLVIDNYILGHTYDDFTYSHVEGASEGRDNLDGRYYEMWGPDQKISSKIISEVNAVEYSGDIRPPNSTATIYLELSLISLRGESISLDNIANELRLSMPLASEGYDFEGKTFTLQQYDPADSTKTYVAYNIKEVIEDSGIIALPNLTGTYASGVPYAYFKLMVSSE